MTASSDILRFRFPFSRIWSHEICHENHKLAKIWKMNMRVQCVYLAAWCFPINLDAHSRYKFRAPRNLCNRMKCQQARLVGSARHDGFSRDRLRRPEWHNRSALSRCVTEAQVHDTLTRPVYHSFDLSRAGSFAARSIRRSSEVAVHRHLVFFGNPRLFAVAFGTGTRAARARQAKNARINDNVS